MMQELTNLKGLSRTVDRHAKRKQAKKSCSELVSKMKMIDFVFLILGFRIDDFCHF